MPIVRPQKGRNETGKLAADFGGMGYHVVSAPPGYDLYYLNVMAGPVREGKIKNDPDHEWLLE